MNDSENQIGKKVRVYWEAEDEWFEGFVEEYHPRRGFRIQYFDGDDEWLKSLDRNIEFLDDIDQVERIDVLKNNLDEIEEDVIIASGNVRDSKLFVSGSYNNNTELNILENDINHLDALDDYAAHVEIEDEMLPEKMIILIGRIFGATALPLTSIDEKDGRVFFRVLYVEGGSRSTMFQCKTTIYKSEFASDLQNPEWQNASFRFEMMLPEDNQLQISLQGEILVALYRNRSQGGSEFIGQTSFQLEEIFRNQSSNNTDHINDVICSHSCSGTYPLIARLGDVAGGNAEVEVDLLFKWRPLHPRPMSVSPPHYRPSSRNGSITNSRNGIHRKALNSPSKLSNRPKSANISSNNSSSKSRSMVSHSAIRRKAEQARIERENNIIFKKLQKHQNNFSKEISSQSTAISSTAENKPSINKKQTSATTTTAAAKLSYYQDDDNKSKAFSRHPSIQPPPPPPKSINNNHLDKAANKKDINLTTTSKDKDNHSSKSSKEVYNQFDDMLSKFNSLKQNVAAMETENKTLKHKASRMKSQLMQYEQALERIKKRNSSLLTPSNNPMTASDEKKDNREPSSSKDKSTKNNQRNPPKKEIAKVEEFDKNDSKKTVVSRATITTKEPINGILMPEDFEDREAKEIATEHVALQDVRRQLIARIVSANERYESAEVGIKELKEQVVLVRGVLFEGHNNSTAKPINKSSTDIVKQQRSTVEQIVVLENRKIVNDLVGSVIDDITETEAMIDHFRQKLLLANQELDRLTFERDTARDRLNDINDENLTIRLRSAISVMNTVLGHARKRQTTEDLITRTNHIDIALLKMSM